MPGLPSSSLKGIHGLIEAIRGQNSKRPAGTFRRMPLLSTIVKPGSIPARVKLAACTKIFSLWDHQITKEYRIRLKSGARTARQYHRFMIHANVQCDNLRSQGETSGHRRVQLRRFTLKEKLIPFVTPLRKLFAPAGK